MPPPPPTNMSTELGTMQPTGNAHGFCMVRLEWHLFSQTPRSCGSPVTQVPCNRRVDTLAHPSLESALELSGEDPVGSRGGKLCSQQGPWGFSLLQQVHSTQEPVKPHADLSLLSSHPHRANWFAGEDTGGSRKAGQPPEDRSPVLCHLLGFQTHSEVICTHMLAR